MAEAPSSDSPENETCDVGCLFSDKRQPSAVLPSVTRVELSPGGTTPPPVESYPGDAFAAMPFYFSGFEDDMRVFQDSTHGAG